LHVDDERCLDTAFASFLVVVDLDDLGLVAIGELDRRAFGNVVLVELGDGDDRSGGVDQAIPSHDEMMPRRRSSRGRRPVTEPGHGYAARPCGPSAS
jgi:hypothetical protein